MKKLFCIFCINLFVLSLTGCEDLYFYRDIVTSEKSTDSAALIDYDKVVDSTSGDIFIIRKPSNGACGINEPSECKLIVQHKDGTEEVLQDFIENKEYTLRETVNNNEQALWLENPSLLEVRSPGHLLIQFDSFSIHMGEVFGYTSVVDYDIEDETVEELLSLKQVGELNNKNSERDSSYYLNTLLTTPSGSFLAVLDTNVSFSDEKLPDNGLFFKTNEEETAWQSAECPGLKLPLTRLSKIEDMPYGEQKDGKDLYTGMWFYINDEEFFIDTALQKCLAPQ